MTKPWVDIIIDKTNSHEVELALEYQTAGECFYDLHQKMYQEIEKIITNTCYKLGLPKFKFVPTSTFAYIAGEICYVDETTHMTKWFHNWNIKACVPKSVLNSPNTEYNWTDIKVEFEFIPKTSFSVVSGISNPNDEYLKHYSIGQLIWNITSIQEQIDQLDWPTYFTNKSIYTVSQTKYIEFIKAKEEQIKQAQIKQFKSKLKVGCKIDIGGKPSSFYHPIKTVIWLSSNNLKFDYTFTSRISLAEDVYPNLISGKWKIISETDNTTTT